MPYIRPFTWLVYFYDDKVCKTLQSGHAREKRRNTSPGEKKKHENKRKIKKTKDERRMNPNW